MPLLNLKLVSNLLEKIQIEKNISSEDNKNSISPSN